MLYIQLASTLPSHKAIWKQTLALSFGYERYTCTNGYRITLYKHKLYNAPKYFEKMNQLEQ